MDGACRREKALAAGGQESADGDAPPSSGPAPAVSAAEEEKVLLHPLPKSLPLLNSHNQTSCFVEGPVLVVRLPAKPLTFKAYIKFYSIKGACPPQVFDDLHLFAYGMQLLVLIGLLDVMVMIYTREQAACMGTPAESAFSVIPLNVTPSGISQVFLS